MPDTILSGPTLPPLAGGQPTSLVVLLHGYGSNGQDLIGMAPRWQVALPSTLFVAPDAPERCAMYSGGRQWWSLNSFTPQALASGVRRSAGALQAFIDAQIAGYDLNDAKVALVGFSQGTMMALHVGPRRVRPVAGIVGYSGMLADPQALVEEALTKPPILLIHGDADPVLPVSMLARTETALELLDFPVSSHVSKNLGHSVDEDGLRRGQEFLSKVFSHTPI